MYQQKTNRNCFVWQCGLLTYSSCWTEHWLLFRLVHLVFSFAFQSFHLLICQPTCAQGFFSVKHSERLVQSIKFNLIGPRILCWGCPFCSSLLCKEKAAFTFPFPSFKKNNRSWNLRILPKKNEWRRYEACYIPDSQVNCKDPVWFSLLLHSSTQNDLRLLAHFRYFPWLACATFPLDFHVSDELVKYFGISDRLLFWAFTWFACAPLFFDASNVLGKDDETVSVLLLLNG